MELPAALERTRLKFEGTSFRTYVFTISILTVLSIGVAHYGISRRIVEEANPLYIFIISNYALSVAWAFKFLIIAAIVVGLYFFRAIKDRPRLENASIIYWSVYYLLPLILIWNIVYDLIMLVRMIF